MNFEYLMPTKVITKKGVSADIGYYANEYHLKYVLIISDKGVEKAGLLTPIYHSLDEYQIQYKSFYDVKPNPHDTDCDRIAAKFSDATIDAIIAIGGGSVIDTAKAVSILCTNKGTIKDYEGMEVAKQPPLPLLCVPTTAGTGSEVTSWSIITDTTKHYKMGVGDQRIIPKLALLDVELTQSMPTSVAASTGLDALTHAIEAYTCRIANPITDGLALHAIRLVKENLATAVQDGDAAARENMLIASLMAGIAFGNADTAGVHCLSEAIGGRYDTSHGVANAIFLPYMFHHNMDADFKRHAEVGFALGVDAGNTVEKAAYETVEILLDFNQQFNIPAFAELDKVEQNDFQQLAETAVQSSSNPNNAKEMAVPDYVKVMEEAYRNVLAYS